MSAQFLRKGMLCLCLCLFHSISSWAQVSFIEFDPLSGARAEASIVLTTCRDDGDPPGENATSFNDSRQCALTQGDITVSSSTSVSGNVAGDTDDVRGISLSAEASAEASEGGLGSRSSLATGSMRVRIFVESPVEYDLSLSAELSDPFFTRPGESEASAIGPFAFEHIEAGGTPESIGDRSGVLPRGEYTLSASAKVACDTAFIAQTANASASMTISFTPIPTGGCCIQGFCFDRTEAQCAAAGGQFFGVNNPCTSCEPAPPTCEVEWVKTQGGAFATSSNWEPAGVPRDEGDGCNNIIFNLPGTYNVTYTNAGANSLFVRRGVPVFLGNTLTLSGRLSPGNTAASQPAIGVGADAGLTFTGGTINASRVTLGDTTGDASSSLTLNPNTQFNVTQDIIIGALQDAELFASGATANSGNLLIGNGPPSPSSLRIEGGTWTSSAIHVSQASEGAATFSTGAVINSTEARIGNTPGQPGKVRLEDAATQWNLSGRLSIGALGEGELEVLTGASVAAGETLVGDIGGEDAKLHLEGSSGASRASLTATGPVTVGAGATGIVEIFGGARLLAQQDMSIGESALSAVTLTGADPNNNPASLDVTGQLQVGLGSVGELFINEDAAVSAAILRVGLGAGLGSVALAANAAKQTSAAGVLSIAQGAQVGLDGGGDLTMTGDTRANVNSLLIGVNSGGNGEVTIGVEPGPAPILNVTGDAVAGVNGTAIFTVQNGAQANIGGEVFVGQANGNGTLQVKTAAGGPQTQLRAFGRIFVGPSETGNGVAKVLGLSSFRSDTGIIIGPHGTLFLQRSANVGTPVFTVIGSVIAVRGTGEKQNGDAPAVIEGDLTVESTGILRIESDGGPAQLKVTGNATLNGTLEVTFPDEDALAQDDTFQLLDIDGDITGAFTTFVFPTRTEDFSGQFDFVNGVLALTIEDPGQPIAGGEGEGEGEGESDGNPCAPLNCTKSGLTGVRQILGDYLVLIAILGTFTLLRRHPSGD